MCWVAGNTVIPSLCRNLKNSPASGGFAQTPFLLNLTVLIVFHQILLPQLKNRSHAYEIARENQFYSVGVSVELLTKLLLNHR